MSYKTILLHLDEHAGVEARVRLAAALCHEMHARLVGATARLPTPAVSLRAGGMNIVSVIEDDGNDTPGQGALVLGKVFASVTDGTDLQATWRSGVGPASDVIAEMSAVADLLVCGTGGTDAAESLVLDDLLMRAGRPVLVVPPVCQEVKFGHAIVAWKNTREARRAISDALPLLARCASVTLLHVAESPAATAPLSDPAAFLDGHGIFANLKILSRGGTPSAQITEYARQHAADLIVLGAYGHGRAREWIFGGVTRDLLGHCPIPCLFSR